MSTLELESSRWARECVELDERWVELNSRLPVLPLYFENELIANSINYIIDVT
jgi:hypothetical protein